jgi:uncharacterized ubiquitin-like protein YukD
MTPSVPVSLHLYQITFSNDIDFEIPKFSNCKLFIDIFLEENQIQMLWKIIEVVQKKGIVAVVSANKCWRLLIFLIRIQKKMYSG